MPRERVPLIDRARADLEAGRPWKARDRLTGWLHQNPTDQDALGLLGDVYMRMGDEPAAGRALMLTERDDEDTRRAVEAFEARYGNTAARIQALGVRVPFDRWPPRVQERLRALQQRADADGLRWIEDRPGSPVELPPKGPWWHEALAMGAFGLLVAPWIVGAIVMAVWITGRFT